MFKVFRGDIPGKRIVKTETSIRIEDDDDDCKDSRGRTSKPDKRA